MCPLLFLRGQDKAGIFIEKIEGDIERENARQKLAQVVEFCELQTCLRKYLLEYFGERWEEENCGGCDVCLTPKEEFDATVIAQKILSAVIRTGDRFGESHISSVLRGKGTKRALELGHDRLSVYGIARDFTRDELKEIVGLVLARGLLVKNGNRYPTLAVTQAGRTFLRRGESMTLTRPNRSSQTVSAHKTTDLEIDQILFQRLRALRKRLADERGVPPYVVFGDKTLQQMAFYLPQTRESFSRIPGVGDAKLEQFSEEFLTVIRGHAMENGLTERNIPPRGVERSRAVQRPGSTYDETEKLLLQKLSISEIAERHGLTEHTIINHLERLVTAGENLDLDHLMPPAKRLVKIRAAFQKAGSLTHLSTIRELLGEEFSSYDELRLVLIYLRQTGRAGGVN